MILSDLRDIGVFGSVLPLQARDGADPQDHYPLLPKGILQYLGCIIPKVLRSPPPVNIQIMRPVPQPRPNTKPTKPALKAPIQVHKHNSYLDVHAAKSGESFGHSTARVCRWISQVSGAELAIFCGGETLSDSTHQLKCDTIYAAHVAVSAI